MTATPRLPPVLLVVAVLATGASALGLPVAKPGLPSEIAAPAPDAGSSPAGGGSCAAGGSPPCGEINPRLILRFGDITRDPILARPGDQFRFNGTIAFTFDADDNGWAPNDATQDIRITFTFPRKPSWVEVAMDPPQVPVPILPTYLQPEGDAASGQLVYHYEVPLNLTVKILKAVKQAPGYEYGKFQIFARSTESGIYNPGYGVREVRFTPTESLQGAAERESPAVTWPVLLGLVGVAAAASRRGVSPGRRG